MANQIMSEATVGQLIGKALKMEPIRRAQQFNKVHSKRNLKTYIEADRYIDAYRDKDGECICVNEGMLGSGDWILYGPGLKTTVIKEVYVSEWESGHKIRSYNQTPKKYQRIIDAWESGEISDLEDGTLHWMSTGKEVEI